MKKLLLILFISSLLIPNDTYAHKIRTAFPISISIKTTDSKTFFKPYITDSIDIWISEIERIDFIKIIFNKKRFVQLFYKNDTISDVFIRLNMFRRHLPENSLHHLQNISFEGISIIWNGVYNKPTSLFTKFYYLFYRKQYFAIVFQINEPIKRFNSINVSYVRKRFKGIYGYTSKGNTLLYPDDMKKNK